MSHFDDPHFFVSGNLALNFIGTLSGRRAEQRDMVRTPAALGDWIRASGLLDRAPECDDATVGDAATLREAAYRLAQAAMAGEAFPDADRRLVNTVARGGIPEATLRPDGTVHHTGSAAHALAAIARSAVELLGGAERERIKECGREGCTRLYIDTSRGGSRRWCDMTVCGNRAKSAAFRARHAEPA
ncbi:CGNR zinc finger domain-containing protein [Nocardia jejuensis]|uniref:CGNR zinc finger domain-containing protein n=1 Tax=Nocardia jejuensis TaxID=328049 RepID=UPI00082CDB4C|nr:ABATE domain-containing protein [Nocardia jejuensis]